MDPFTLAIGGVALVMIVGLLWANAGLRARNRELADKLGRYEARSQKRREDHYGYRQRTTGTGSQTYRELAGVGR